MFEYAETNTQYVGAPNATNCRATRVLLGKNDALSNNFFSRQSREIWLAPHFCWSVPISRFGCGPPGLRLHANEQLNSSAARPSAAQPLNHLNHSLLYLSLLTIVLFAAGRGFFISFSSWTSIAKTNTTLKSNTHNTSRYGKIQ